MAFQGLTQADNTGYIIPTPVINRFLTDVKDGSYDKYMDLGMSSFPLFNPAMRKALGLPDDDRGVMVASVIPEGPCDGKVQEGDVLLAIDGKPIDSAGNINVDGEILVLEEIVERKFANDKVVLDFLRDGKEQQAELTLCALPSSNIFSIRYDERPKYVFYAGLVLQPINLNTMSVHKLDSVSTRFLTRNFLPKGIFKERPEVVALTRVESDAVTASVAGFSGTVVNTINGEEVRDLAHAYELLYQTEQPEFTVIECEDRGRPIVIPSAKVPSVNSRLMQTNNIPATHYLGQ